MSRFLQRYFKRPFPRQIYGDIRLGYILGSNTVFGIFKKELVQHFLIVGRSGSGKTNVIRIIQLELNRLGIPFISFDLAKYGTRFIKHYIPDLLILRWHKEFLFNPLKNPQGVSIKEWLMAFSEITSEVFGFRVASKLFLIEFILNIYDEYKTEKTGLYPTLHDINKKLGQKRYQNIPQNEKNYIDTLRNKLKTICMVLEESIDVQKGISIERLLKYPVCIELIGIKSTEIQIWIMSLILAWIACYRESNQQNYGKLQHVFFYDEAAKVLGKGDI